VRGYTVEYKTGRISISNGNILVKDITDMETLEFWEDRLKKLNQPFLVAFRKVSGKIKYSIFTKVRKKGSIFR
jgi:hypothetical protein